MSTHNDRNLLFGIVALQLSFVNRDQLVVGINAWVRDKSKSLADLLIAHGALAPECRALLDPIVEKHIQQHGDAQRSLAALSSVDAARQALEGVIDSDVAASLAHLPPAKGGHEVPAIAPDYSTRPPCADDPTASRFHILRHHAKGGLGVVFVARDREINREVALKEIQTKHAHDSVSRSRFLLEAEITGGLEHPGIVPVYGLGQYPDGRPFYAMRFIKGDSLKEAADAFHQADKDAPRRDPADSDLALRRLLRRFIDVCNAIDYAHAKGVLHRDLKPGNIMLGKYGETLVVDWGLAKAMNAGEGSPSATQPDEPPLLPTTASSETVFGRAIGTPAYMPPEQAAGRLDLLGPASDVYSLGATLYHVLTGQPPFLDPDPSVTLSDVQKGKFPRPRAAKPNVDAGLEAICLKAMAKDPADRYTTAALLRQDVENWIVDAPITARRDPLTVKLRRFVMRHRIAATAATATLTVAIVFLAILTYITGQKNEQLAGLLRRAEDSEKTAVIQFNKLKKQNELLESIFTDIDSDRAEKGRPLLVERLTERLIRTADSLDVDADGDPLAVARLQFFLGRTLVSLGEATRAIDLHRRALDTRKKLLGADHPDTLTSMAGLADNYLGTGELDQALPLCEEALKLRKAKLGLDHPDTLTSMNDLAFAYTSAGKPDLALSLLEETLELRKRLLGPDHPDTLKSMQNLASWYMSAGKLNLALPTFQESMRLTKAELGPGHPFTLLSMNNLANGYESAGRLDLALPLFEETLKLSKAKLGPNHPNTLTSMNNLAFAYGSAGQRDLALSLHEETFKLMKAKLGPDHPTTLISMINVANGYHSAGKLELALPLFEEALKRTKAKLGPDHPDTLTSMNNLANGYESAGRLDLALPLFEETLKLSKAKLGPNHPNTLTSMNNLAFAYGSADKRDLALSLHEETFKLMKAKLGPDHPMTLISMINVANGYHSAGELELALPLFEEALKRTKAKLGPGHPDTLTSMDHLAYTYYSANKLGLALPLYEEALKLRRTKLGPDHPETLTNMDNLANTYNFAREVGLALPLYEEGWKLRKAKLGPDHPDTLTSMNNVANGYQSAGKLDQALPLFEEALKLRKAKLGLDHPDTLTSMNNLANGYESAGRLDLALPLFEETLKLTKAKLGPDHASTLTIMNDLGGAYLKDHQPKKALTFFTSALEVQRRIWGKTDRRLAVELSVISISLLNNEQFSAAEPLLRECLEIQSKNPPDLWMTSLTKTMLGRSLVGQKKFADAEPYLLEGFKEMKSREEDISPIDKWGLVEAEGSLADLFAATRTVAEKKLTGELTAERTSSRHEVKVEKAKPVVILMQAKDFDPIVILADSDGKTLAKGNGILPVKNRNSRIVFFPPADGVFRVIASSLSHEGRGSFEIIVRQYGDAKTK